MRQPFQTGLPGLVSLGHYPKKYLLKILQVPTGTNPQSSPNLYYAQNNTMEQKKTKSYQWKVKHTENKLFTV
jgi:hypothetical protein